MIINKFNIKECLRCKDKISLKSSFRFAKMIINDCCKQCYLRYDIYDNRDFYLKLYLKDYIVAWVNYYEHITTTIYCRYSKFEPIKINAFLPIDIDAEKIKSIINFI